MSLDVRVSSRKAIICPHCGEVVGCEEMDRISVDARKWSVFLKEIDNYPKPFEDWHGKDMPLTTEQARRLVEYAKEYDPYIAPEIKTLVSEAIFDGDEIVISADWG